METASARRASQRSSSSSTEMEVVSVDRCSHTLCHTVEAGTRGCLLGEEIRNCYENGILTHVIIHGLMHDWQSFLTTIDGNPNSLENFESGCCCQDPEEEWEECDAEPFDCKCDCAYCPASEKTVFKKERRLADLEKSRLAAKACTIQRFVRGWLTRRSYTWNPSCTFCRYILDREFGKNNMELAV